MTLSRTLRPGIVGIALLATGLALASCREASDIGTASVSSAARIRELRERADYAGAAQVARSAAEVQARDSRTTPATHAEARRLAQVLQGYASLDPAARAELSEADRLDPTVDSLEAAGELSDGYALLTRQLEIRGRRLGVRHADVARTLRRLGQLATQRGNSSEGVALLGRALEMQRALFGKRNPEVAATLFQLAVAQKNSGRWRVAQTLHQEALALRRELCGPSSPEVAESLNGLANVHRVYEDFPGALRLMNEALAIRRHAYGEDHLDVADSRMDIGLVELRLGDYRAAENQLRRALAIRRRHLGPKNFELGVTLDLLGISLLAQPKLAPAEVAFREAAAIAEQARLRAAPGPIKASRYRLTMYNNLAAVLLARGLETEAWNQLERGQAREFLEALIPTSSEDHGRSFPLERIQRAVPKNTAIVGWLDVTPGIGEPHSAWGYVIRDHGPVHWARLQPAGITIGPIATSHAPRLLQLVYGAASWPVHVDETSDVKREGMRLWRERLEPLMPYLTGVEELVVTSSAAFQGAVDPMVCPDERWLADRYAIAYAPSATTFAVWAERRQASPTAPGPALLIGDPPFSEGQVAGAANVRSGSVLSRVTPVMPTVATALSRSAGETAGLPRLAGSRWEIEQLRQIFPHATVLLGTDASEPRLYQLARAGRLDRFETIHLASHMLNRGPFEQWAIVLAQVGHRSPGACRTNSVADAPNLRTDSVVTCDPNDGLLTGQEIRDHLSLRCDLVSLSGCFTAAGGNAYTSSILSFGNAFLYAGAHSILASLWLADDRASALLMTRFHEDRAGAYADDRGEGPGAPMRKVRALQEAKRWLREWHDPSGRVPYRHPAYWAGFVLIGDPG